MAASLFHNDLFRRNAQATLSRRVVFADMSTVIQEAEFLAMSAVVIILFALACCVRTNSNNLNQIVLQSSEHVKHIKVKS